MSQEACQLAHQHAIALYALSMLYHAMQALRELNYPEKLQRLLLTPQREVLVELVITKDNGEIETFNAYRVQHDDSRGPYKGGLRYHPQVDLDDVRRCAWVPICVLWTDFSAAMQLLRTWMLSSLPWPGC